MSAEGSDVDEQGGTRYPFDWVLHKIEEVDEERVVPELLQEARDIAEGEGEDVERPTEITTRTIGPEQTGPMMSKGPQGEGLVFVPLPEQREAGWTQEVWQDAWRVLPDGQADAEFPGEGWMADMMRLEQEIREKRRESRPFTAIERFELAERLERVAAERRGAGSL